MNGTVYVVDDDESVRDSVRYLMESVGLCVRTFASSREFFHSEPMAGPSCLILDLRMPEVSGLETQEQLCQRGYESPVIIMTGHGDVPAAVRAMKLGALDFLEKPCNDQELLDKVQKAIDQDAIRIRQDRDQDAMMANLLTLSLREKQVMDLIVGGKSNKETAAVLNVSPKTVETHRANLMRKLKVNSLAELVQLSVLLRRVELPEQAS